MQKIKVLWMSNKIQSNKNDNYTGSWLNAMAQGLIKTGEIELANISHGVVSKVIRQDFGEINQWIVPNKPNTAGKPRSRSIPFSKEIIEIVTTYSPDLIHVWGTEDVWGQLTSRDSLNRPVLLEMQGLKGAIARVFDGGLSLREKFACIGLKEILKRYSIFQEQKEYEKWGFIEKEIIAGHQYITVQTYWIEAQVRAVNSKCKIFRNDRLLRDIFYDSTPWQYTDNLNILCSAAYPSPFKGLHVAIRATAILKKQFPNIQLNIAGALQRPGIRQDGYIGWLNHEIKKLNLETNVKWLGALTAAQMVDEFKSTAVMVLPSFIENCSNLVQEGMMIGIPIVVSYVGGLPSLASDEVSSLFYYPDDEIMCAYQIHRLLSDRSLAENISRKAREIARERNDYQKVVQNQIEIYRQVKNNRQRDEQRI